MNPEPDTLIDPVDGRVYRTVRIGSQVWMAENLDAGHYRNGDPIPLVEHPRMWGRGEKGACCFQGNDPGNGSFFGRLYNWFAVNDPRGLAPEGWHVPEDSEWQELEMYLGMRRSDLNRTGWRGDNAGGKLKEQGTRRWKEPNTGATNEAGFNAVPGGYRDVDGSFYVLGTCCYWWSATEYTDHFAWYRSLYYTSYRIHRTNSYVGDGFSVRCIRDLPG